MDNILQAFKKYLASIDQKMSYIWPLILRIPAIFDFKYLFEFRSGKSFTLNESRKTNISGWKMG